MFFFRRFSFAYWTELFVVDIIALFCAIDCDIFLSSYSSSIRLPLGRSVKFRLSYLGSGDISNDFYSFPFLLLSLFSSLKERANYDKLWFNFFDFVFRLDYSCFYLPLSKFWKRSSSSSYSITWYEGFLVGFILYLIAFFLKVRDSRVLLIWLSSWISGRFIVLGLFAFLALNCL